MTRAAIKCMCDWDTACSGTGVLHCLGCAGDACWCQCGGECDCDGCENCTDVEDRYDAADYEELEP
jgi:hypothetical protein